MTDEDDRQADIARILKLRGRASLKVKTIEERAAERITPTHMVLLFDGAHSHSEALRELELFDDLPPELRAFLRESPVNISARMTASLLEDIPDLQTLMSVIEAKIPARGRELATKRYGPEHPQASADRFDHETQHSVQTSRWIKAGEKRRKWLSNRIRMG